MEMGRRTMLRLLKNRMKDERGIAIVTAMLVSMVVVVLGVTSVSISIHNAEQSANDRRRVQSVAVAEAGINYFYSHIQSEPTANLSCVITKTLAGTTPPATFTATTTYYNSAGTALPCVANHPVGTPAAAYVRSVGNTAANQSTGRTMETYVTLSPISSSPFADTAIFSNNSFAWPANIQIRGSDASNNNVYTNGTASFNSSTTIYGNVYAQGGITMRGSSQIRRDAWANGAVSMSNNSSILANATSSTSSITLGNGPKIYGNARAGTTITAGATQILGTRTPNSPQAAPPVKAFPTYTFNAADWTSNVPPYQVSTQSSCASARSFIKNIASGNWVVRIASDCLLSFSKRDVPTIRGHLAIISDGGLFVDTNNYLNPIGGPWNVHMIFGIDNDGAPCDITWQNNTAIGANINAFFYTPCAVTFRNNISIASGQIFGGSVNLSSNTSITYKEVPIPGFGAAGYRENIQYIREVITT
jgi:Tfp pilus assembly protein PilX